MRHAADIHVGETIVVIGIGGVGSSCLQVEKAIGGSKIIVVDVQDEKIKNDRKEGETHIVNTLEVNFVDTLKKLMVTSQMTPSSPSLRRMN